jgi:FkbM family methyltransferase
MNSLSFRTLGRRLLPLRLRGFVRSFAFQMLDLHWQLPSNLHIRIRSISDWFIYNEVFVSQAYDQAILMALERAKGSGELQVLDLGANVGFFSLRCVDVVRRQQLQGLSLHITAIEGNPRSYRELQLRLCKDNNLPSFTAINGLVGAKNGTATISDLEFSGQNQVGVDRSQKHFMVDYVDLEQVLGTGRIGLLKCDVEGAELVFLQNYPQLLQRTDVAVFELHPQHCDEKECISLLRGAGFTNQAALPLANVIMAVRSSQVV